MFPNWSVWVVRGGTLILMVASYLVNKKLEKQHEKVRLIEETQDFMRTRKEEKTPFGHILERASELKIRSWRNLLLLLTAMGFTLSLWIK